jgi:hypothetical protein
MKASQRGGTHEHIRILGEERILLRVMRHIIVLWAHTWWNCVNRQELSSYIIHCGTVFPSYKEFSINFSRIVIQLKMVQIHKVQKIGLYSLKLCRRSGPQCVPGEVYYLREEYFAFHVLLHEDWTLNSLVALGSQSCFFHIYKVSWRKASKIKILYLRKHLLYTFMGLHHYKGKLSSFFWVYNILSKFQCLLPWWHDKYPDDIRSRSTLFEACFVLP